MSDSPAIPLSSATLPRFFFFINGIRTNLADQVGGWQYRAERYIEQNTSHRADSYAYQVGAFNRWIHQAKHVKEAGDILLQRSKIQEIKVLVGHSNGCDIICRMFKEYPMLQAGAVHLIAGAVEDSFEKNCLNEALQRRQIGELFIYCSREDRALKFAKMTHWVNWINRNWGYGDLGLVGPSEVAEDVLKCVWPRWFEGYDHGTYFWDNEHPDFPGISYFERTMQLILGQSSVL